MPYVPGGDSPAARSGRPKALDPGAALGRVLVPAARGERKVVKEMKK
jgi:hypothetical protein